MSKEKCFINDYKLDLHVYAHQDNYIKLQCQLSDATSFALTLAQMQVLASRITLELVTTMVLFSKTIKYYSYLF